jgi:hypothetical protein
MAQVAAERTTLTPAQALGVLAEALGPDRAALPMVAAQSAVETGHWKAMWHWNFGNVTADASSDYQILPKNQLHFKVYGSPQEGARDYIAWLRRRGILDYAIRGDLPGYIAHLKSAGYLGFVGRTAPGGHVVSDKDYDDYASGIAGLIRSFETMRPEPIARAVVRSGSTRGRAIVTAAAIAVGAAVLMNSRARRR